MHVPEAQHPAATHSRLLVSDGLVAGPIHNLPGVGNKAGDGHPMGLIDAVDSAVTRGEKHLVQDGLLDRKDDAIAALEAEGRTAVLDGLGGVLDLENAPVRRESRGGEVVSAACRHVCLWCFYLVRWLVLRRCWWSRYKNGHGGEWRGMELD